MYCFYQLFLKPYPRQGSLTSKIKHFKRDSLPLSILGWSYFPVKNTVLEYGRRWGPVDNMSGSCLAGRRLRNVRLRVRPPFSKFTSILNYTVY